MAKNANLHTAKVEKNDEFYTRYEDIEAEVMRYRDHFHGKTVLCNCDDPEWSNFWQFFHRNFSFFQLKKLISTHYVENGSSYAMIYDGTRDKVEPLTRNEKIANNEQMSLFEMCTLTCNGDFRSEECLKYLDEADIIVTNPPFSLFREFIATLVEKNKKFLVLGNINAITYKEIFPLIKDNKMWIGYGFNTSLVFKAPYANELESNRKFVKSKGLNPEDGYVKVPAVAWFTNLDTVKRHEDLILWKEYNEKDYPKYDNYDAINVDKVADIPCNYYGYMGVPITFLDKYNPEQFEIVGMGQGNLYRDLPNVEYGLSKKFVEDYYLSGQKGAVKEDHPVLGYYDSNNKPVIPYMRYIIRRKYDNNGNLIK